MVKVLIRGVVLGMLFSVASWLPEPLARQPVEAAAAGRCAPSVSCGYGCSGRLASGYCVDVARFDSGRLNMGPVSLPVSLHFDCSICDCMYLVTDRRGNRKLRRSSRLECDGGFGGIRIFG